VSSSRLESRRLSWKSRHHALSLLADLSFSLGTGADPVRVDKTYDEYIGNGWPPKRDRTAEPNNKDSR
jgi:hypothetical protein